MIGLELVIYPRNRAVQTGGHVFRRKKSQAGADAAHAANEELLGDKQIIVGVLAEGPEDEVIVAGEFYFFVRKLAASHMLDNKFLAYIYYQHSPDLKVKYICNLQVLVLQFCYEQVLAA